MEKMLDYCAFSDYAANQRNKFNSQSFFSYNIKEIIDESIIKKQVKNQLSAVKKVTNKGNTYGKF